MPLLDVKNLKVFFYTDEGVVEAVNDVSYSVDVGKTLGVVGESGSGKSVSAMTIMKLIPMPPGRVLKGSISFDDKDILNISEREMRTVRGNDIAMIFQDPMTSLNPVLTIGDQISESLILHKGMSKKEAWDFSGDMLEKVKIPLPRQRLGEYPFQLSGGMRQRVMIAIALCCFPKLLIADEPTTALDVTVQAQILDLINELQQDYDSAVMMITHDLGVVAEVADDVVVMYAGMVMEAGNVRQIFHDPQHPYTKGLLSCLPRFDIKSSRLEPIQGQPPNPSRLPVGCPYSPRCPQVHPRCGERPPSFETDDGRLVRCWLCEGKLPVAATETEPSQAAEKEVS